MAEVVLQSKQHEFLISKARKSQKTASTYEKGLKWLNRFVEVTYPTETAETLPGLLLSKTVDEKVIPPKLDVYRFFDSYVSYLMTPDFKLKPASIENYVYCAKSYLAFNDVDISNARFKSKVTLPANRKEDEYPIDISEARLILSNATNRRLRSMLFFLGSTGTRPTEACAIRYQDIDYSTGKVYMQAKYSKNKLPREVYLTKEAIAEMKLWDELKLKGREYDPSELVFAFEDQSVEPFNIYMRISSLFRNVLDSVNKGQWKDKRRRMITLYSFRRFVETTIEDHTSANFADYILGHKKSPYYSKKEPERRQLYYDKCEAHLTYLDYNALEKAAKEKLRGEEAIMVELRKMAEKIALLEKQRGISV